MDRLTREEYASLPPRIRAWFDAQELVAPIVEQHGVEDYTAGNIFGPSRFTKVDQHLDQIMRVADWLLEGTNGP